MDDQREVISFLSEAASYGKAGLPVERLETHISIVFLIGDRAYKLKRAVRFSYLDYSTTKSREWFCKAEFELNRRTAPALYLRVRAITREADGNLAFDGDGILLDWILEMQRFAQDDLFARLAAARQLTPDLMRELTAVISEFHAHAEVIPDHGGRAAIEQTIDGNHANLLQSCPPLDPHQVQRLHAASMLKLSTLGSLLDTRMGAGKVRRCHGDLHLRNICLFEGRPTPFDCIEFNDALSCIDVLYDLAFLLMDLVQRGMDDLANIVFNRYLDLTADLEGLATVPLFMSVRAAVRAHVLAAQDRQHPSTPSSKSTEAHAYLSLAISLLNPHPSCLIAIGGLSGVGKSTLAQVLAPAFAPAPGARIIRSDILRKRLFNMIPEIPLPPSAYETTTTERVYRGLHDRAAASLAAGYTAIVDATFLREGERRRIAGLAEISQVPFIGLWLEAQSDVLTGRISTRGRDASDADLQVVQQQLKSDTGPINWHRVDTTCGLGTYLPAVWALIEPSAAACERSRPTA
jgi:uncharacterized protein